MVDNKEILNYTKLEHLSVPAKTVLLEKGKVADRLYLIHKGCLRLYFYNNGNDVTFQFFFENDIVASFDSLYYQMLSSDCFLPPYLCIK